MRHHLRLCLLLVLLLAAAPAGADEDAVPPAKLPEGASAFRFETETERVRRDVPLDHVRKGVARANPRDVIPALRSPRFTPVADAAHLRAEDLVIAVTVGEAAHAYPLHVLDRHELVNDVVGGQAVLVTWCPLCGSSVVFDRVVDGHTLTFGVSGYLLKSDVLMYDEQTESFWCQLLARAVMGPFTGRALAVLPSRVMRFGAFAQAHPTGQVLGAEQGFVPAAAYRRPLYPGYVGSRRLAFPVGARSDLLHPKAEVVGFVVASAVRAWALEGLRRLEAPLEERLGGTLVRITYEPAGDLVRVTDASGRLLPATRLYWFAWYAFHPETDLWRAPGEPVARPAPAGAPR